MRFCPFCAQENSDDARECGHCGKRLPAMPPPRTPSAPPMRPQPAVPVRPKPAPRSRPLTGRDGAPAPVNDTILQPNSPFLDLSQVTKPSNLPAPSGVRAPTPAAGIPRTRPPTPAQGVRPRTPTPPPIQTGPLSSDEGTTEPRPTMTPDDFGGETADDPHASATDAVGAAAPLFDPSATPMLPTLALPLMPPVPERRTIVASVAYLWPLARAVWARRQAQRSVRELLHGDQRLLDQVLRELGRAAREANVETPAIADEMRRVREQEDRRAQAEAALLQGDADKTAEDARWQEDEAGRQADIARRDSEFRTSEQELKLKNDERRVHDAERARLEAQIKAAEARAQTLEGRAVKAEMTPPEKGGGPNTAANFRAEAESARREATSLAPARDAALAKLASLEGPSQTLSAGIETARAELLVKRKELADAQAAHKEALASFAAGKKSAEGEREGAEREMSQRFVAAGTLLNLHRVDSPAFVEIYARIDELKAGVNAREGAIVRLEAERHSYDREAVQKGLITVGVAFGVLVIAMVVLIVLLAR